MDNKLQAMEKDLVDKLTKVRDDYISTKEQLVLSIRKDVLLAELKDMLIDNTDFYSLKNAIEDYIRGLEDDINGKNR